MAQAPPASSNGPWQNGVVSKSVLRFIIGLFFVMSIIPLVECVPGTYPIRRGFEGAIFLTIEDNVLLQSLVLLRLADWNVSSFCVKSKSSSGICEINCSAALKILSNVIRGCRGGPCIICGAKVSSTGGVIALSCPQHHLLK